MVIAAPVNTRDAWSERAETFPDPWTACGWSRSGQADRFEAVLDALEPRPGESLLDYGCGTGELSEWVPRDVGYVGYDPAPGMVARAAADHHGRVFQNWEPLGGFDLVACVGPFNLPGHWSKLMTWAELRRLWERTGRKLACSLYAGPDERCLSYTLDECVRFAAAECYRAWAHRWRHNDILIVLER